MLYSNTPKAQSQLRPQYDALCHALKLEPSSPSTLVTLKDPSQTPAESITKAIDDEVLGPYGTFRGTLDGVFLPFSDSNADPTDPMTWQRSGLLAKGLLEHGVRCVIVGDLTEEWYLYSIAHPIRKPSDIKDNLLRYYPEDIVTKMSKIYRTPKEDESEEELMKLFGEMLSEGQVHLPVRLLARDLKQAGFPVCRYEIRWTPEQVRPRGKDVLLRQPFFEVDLRTLPTAYRLRHPWFRPFSVGFPPASAYGSSSRCGEGVVKCD